MKKSIARFELVAATGWALTMGSAPGAEALPYPLDVCIVTGEKLGAMGEPFTLQHDGREIRFCCGGCVKTFQADPPKYLARIDAAVMEAQRPLYPLRTCVVDSLPLGDAPVDFLHRNALVRVDREACRTAFEAAPEGPQAALERAVVAQQGPSYPLETCVVTGEKLGSMGAPVDYVFQNRLVRFCCAGCIGTFRADPFAYLQKIPAPSAASPPAAAPAAR